MTSREQINGLLVLTWPIIPHESITHSLEAAYTTAITITTWLHPPCIHARVQVIDGQSLWRAYESRHLLAQSFTTPGPHPHHRHILTTFRVAATVVNLTMQVHGQHCIHSPRGGAQIHPVRQQGVVFH